MGEPSKPSRHAPIPDAYGNLVGTSRPCDAKSDQKALSPEADSPRTPTPGSRQATALAPDVVAGEYLRLLPLDEATDDFAPDVSPSNHSAKSPPSPVMAKYPPDADPDVPIAIKPDLPAEPQIPQEPLRVREIIPHACPRAMTAQAKSTLPRLPRFSLAYLMLLMGMVVGFYMLVLVSLALIVAAAGGLVWGVVTSGGYYASHLRYLGIRTLVLLLPVLAAVLIGLVMVGVALVKGMFVRVGNEEVGIRLNRIDHDEVFRLTDRVALDIGAPVIERIYLTPGTEMAVREEAAIWMPPGLGRRTLMMGMALLDRITPEQLQSVLAHEYGHFSSRDTFFSRFVGRVHTGFVSLIVAMRLEGWHAYNPIYWLFFGYGYLFFWVAAGHSRLREFYADRFAVELYGRETFEQSMIGGYVEGMFVEQVWFPRLANLATSGGLPANMYHRIGVSRMTLHAKAGTDGLLGILAGMYEIKPSKFDSHPTIVQRLAMQGVNGGDSQIPSPTRVSTMPLEEEEQTSQKLAILRAGPPSAAERLFGSSLSQIQTRLTTVFQAEVRWHQQLARMARNLGI